MSMTFTLNKATGEVAFVEEEDHSEEGEAHSGEEDIVNPVIPNIYDVIWAAVFFFALWGLMKFVLLPPIIQGRDERRAKAAAARDAVDGAEAELNSIRAEHEEKLASARSEAGRIIDAARADVEADRASQVGAVEAEIAQQKAAASAEVDAARAQAMAGAKGDVGQLAAGAASAVLGRNIDAASQQSILDSYLDS